MFGCTVFLLRLPRKSKFDPRAMEGLYLESLPHVLYKVLIRTAIKHYAILESPHVTFDEFRFLGALDLEHYMSDELSLDETKARKMFITNSLKNLQNYCWTTMTLMMMMIKMMMMARILMMTEMFDDGNVEDNDRDNTADNHSTYIDALTQSSEIIRQSRCPTRTHKSPQR